MSPMPQLVEDGHENNGMSRPACRRDGAHSWPATAQSKRRRTRSIPSANCASAASRLTTRYDSRGKSKKYPGCISTPSFRSRSSTSASSGFEGRHFEDRVPATLRSSSTRHAGIAAHVLPKHPVIGGHAAGNLFADDGAPIAAVRRRRPAPASTPTDTCRRRAPAARARHRRARPGRPTAIHASFTCGSPTVFDSPPSENARTSRRSSTRPADARAPGVSS